MKPRIFPITICRNEDQFIGATLRAWLPFADTMFVQDTGSIDRTMGEVCDIFSSYPGKVMVGQHEMGVGEAMVERSRLIERIPKDHDYWILVLDADEVWPESQVRALLARLEDDSIDYVAVRPVSIGYDLATTYEPYYFDPPLEKDYARYTTPYFCPKWTTRAFRSNRLDKIVNPSWGGETMVVKWDDSRHTLTRDARPQDDVPPGYVSTMFTGRTAYTDIYFNHCSYMTRSSKWAEIPPTPGSNATDRARWRTRGRHGQFPLPQGFEIAESVRHVVSSEAVA